ncbi:hypothetical protein [Erwinia sp.]|uniref:hypothetical protein n=1 Tax=Erwinia citreus TaxID=558 RepID=UPI00289A7B4C|nr:hypothetical protein [Erwinia sp.]
MIVTTLRIVNCQHALSSWLVQPAYVGAMPDGSVPLAGKETRVTMSDRYGNRTH